MCKKIFYRVFVVGLIIASAGCGVRTHAYVTRKERVDQDPTGPKKTRQVFVVEMEKVHEQKKDMAIDSTTKSPGSNSVISANPATPAQFMDTPPISDDKKMSSHLTAPQPDAGPFKNYTVQKDDTLQKIAKKFYNSYGKWTKIYQANREKIKDPNFVKPGTELAIPF